MLGKRCWRFITNPDSLVARIYRARYFKNTTFINAKLGHSPSFIWRSLMEAKQVILKRSRWRIGTGKDISIMGQPWLEDKDNPFIVTGSQAVTDNSVSSLMCTNRREWDLDIINSIFEVRDHECIKTTRIENDLKSDMLQWNGETSGQYSVKSAYRLLQTQDDHQLASSFWKSLWQIKAPKKALNLIWRALANFLPTKM
ncbi:hypothetical protein AgCh_023702 [Apium graveolens]